MGLDDFIWGCWKLDGTGWRFNIISDLWWEIEARSEALGTFRTVTAGPVWGVEEALGELFAEIEKAKGETGGLTEDTGQGTLEI